MNFRLALKTHNTGLKPIIFTNKFKTKTTLQNASIQHTFFLLLLFFITGVYGAWPQLNPLDTFAREHGPKDVYTQGGANLRPNVS